MKHLFAPAAIFSFLFFSLDNGLKSQEIEFEKGKVLIDGKECLRFEGSNPNSLEFTTLNGDYTIYLKYIRTEIDHVRDVYNKIIFAEQKKSLTSHTFIFTRKTLLNKLIQDKVLVDCRIDTNMLDKFIMKHDENVENLMIDKN